MMKIVRPIVCCLLILLAWPASSRAVTVLSGSLTSTGSDTLANLLTGWGMDFNRRFPEVGVQIQASGSATAAAALTAGTTQLGPMSRPMTEPEVDAFRRHYGYPPSAVPVALDAVVILVNEDNPLQSLPLSQLDGIFSITHSCGPSPALKRWGDLGLKGHLAGQTLLRYGRNSASGTYGYFRQRVLCGGDLLTSVNELPGSVSVAQAVAGSVNAIGYAGMGFHASGVKILALTDGQGKTVQPDDATLLNGEYPLVRYLYIYVNKAPDRPLEPITAAFFDQILSPGGQLRARQNGYRPLPEAVRLQARRNIGLE
ncbi:PstS family phosphate ABC transporter substrate-binding protein [Sodalis sp. RH16]|uniref:PstS family phosphate ABC transporter substrate-binding protein n=1 Tax=Sodalis sp. RH16 TaxID=3394331 RepID=UPI0039B5D23F